MDKNISTKEGDKLWFDLLKTLYNFKKKSSDNQICEKKKNENKNIRAKEQKTIKYVDNTPKGCNISINSDTNNNKFFRIQ